MNNLEQRVLDALGDSPGTSSWESLMALFRSDREAFYLLACDGAGAEASARLLELAGLARRIREAVRGTYQIESSEEGAHIVGFRVAPTFIPAHLVVAVAKFLLATDGKGVLDGSGKDYEGVRVSEAEVRFRLGERETWEAERKALQEWMEAKPEVPLRRDASSMRDGRIGGRRHEP
jgi:hypothetical protein